MVDLQGRVFDPETVLEYLLELAANCVAVISGRHEDVRGEGGEAGRVWMRLTTAMNLFRFIARCGHLQRPGFESPATASRRSGG